MRHGPRPRIRGDRTRAVTLVVVAWLLVCAALSFNVSRRSKAPPPPPPSSRDRRRRNDDDHAGDDAEQHLPHHKLETRFRATAKECLEKSPFYDASRYPREFRSAFVDYDEGRLDPEIERHYHEMINFTAQFRSFRVHQYAGYGGPWIENHFLARFCCNRSLSDFGGFVPLFVQWLDGFLKLRATKYQSDLLNEVAKRLRRDVIYVTVSQNDAGIPTWKMEGVEQFGNVLVLSAGGFGHIPIPLMADRHALVPQPGLEEEERGEERRDDDVDVDVDKNEALKYVTSFVGTVRKGVRQNATTLARRVLGTNRFIAYKGPEWKEVMRRSATQMTPRGFGRASFHANEVIQMGMIPIYIWNDHEWMPYRGSKAAYDYIGYSVRIDEFEKFVRVELLGNLTRDEMMKSGGESSSVFSTVFGSTSSGVVETWKEKKRRIRAVRDSHYTYEGVLDQIEGFLMRGESDLKCQPHPSTNVEWWY